MKRYIVIYKDKTAFQTDWYTHENCWSDDIFCVVDSATNSVTFDGKWFLHTKEDHL